MSTRASKKAKLEDLPVCPYGMLFIICIVTGMRCSVCRCEMLSEES